MNITITKRLEMDYGHRVLGHDGHCRFLHGHRGLVDLVVRAPKLDELGRVVDFGVIKQRVGQWLVDNFDHNILLHPKDPLAILYQNMGDKKIYLADYDTEKIMGSIDSIFNGKSPFIMPNGNPTAENIAEVIYNKAVELLPLPLRVVKIRFWETPSSYAAYHPPIDAIFDWFR